MAFSRRGYLNLYIFSCNDNAKKRLGEQRACNKMIDDLNFVMKND